MICFKIRIFVPRQTSWWRDLGVSWELWFALKFVSLCQDKHLRSTDIHQQTVVICFKIRIFVPRQTSADGVAIVEGGLWFALKFVSLCQDKHRWHDDRQPRPVVICFKIRIFVPRQTSRACLHADCRELWFALKFVSLCQDKHHRWRWNARRVSCDLL